ncbi:MAG TPA: heme-binding protein [Dongiaceae bacterium]|nr:heme-binding protein [Dongiaceae bacterium]
MPNTAVPRPLEYGAPISLEQAKGVMAAAEAEARANDWPMVIAIVDSGGHLVMLHSFDHAQHGSVAIAQEKARCAVNFKRPTKAFEDAVAQGGLNLRILAAPGMVPLEGGLPLIAGGRIVGAIGVSGMRSNQDGQVAEAGAKALSRES